MLNPLEIPLFQAIAINPDENARHIASPQSMGLLQWVSTPLARNVFARIGQLAAENKKITFVAIAALYMQNMPSLTADEVEYLLGLWNGAKQTPSDDLPIVIDALKNDYLIRSSEKAMVETMDKNRAQPGNVTKHIGDLGSRLSVLSRHGMLYDPDPASHRNDPVPVVSGTWGNPTLNMMYDGGIPSMGYAVMVGPSGHGKSTIGRTKAALLVAHRVRTLYCTNESTMPAGEVSKRIHRALKVMWAGQRDDEEIWGDMSQYLKVYDMSAGAYDIHQIDRFAYWDQPRVLIMDSLDNLNFPKGSERYDDGERHHERANFFARMTTERNCFTVMVGNGSKGEQVEIMKDISKVNIPMVYGSVWYHNMSSYSFVFCRSGQDPKMADIKRCKSRGELGSGEMMYLRYDAAGGYYDQPYPGAVLH